MLQRFHEAEGFIQNSLESMISTLDEEIKRVQTYLEEKIKGSEEWSHKCEILQSIPGVGKFTSIVLLTLLKELGEVSPQAVAALAGVAP